MLEELGEAVRDASLCGLGQSLPNPVLSAVTHFRDEFEAHIRDKVCPGGVCKALFQYEIDESNCTRCGLCKKNCSYGAIEGERKSVHRIIADRCTKCGACYEVCPADAVVKVPAAKREALATV